MTDLTKLTMKQVTANIPAALQAEIRRRLERLEKCEAALLKARMLLINEGDPDEDAEMIAEIDELLGNAARVRMKSCQKRGFHDFKEFIDPKSGGFMRCKDCGKEVDCEDPDGDLG